MGVQITDMSFFQMLAVLWSNAPASVLYLGKTTLPLNLTVLPVLGSSTFIYGFATLAFIVLYWFFSRTKILSLSTLGLLWFFAFLVPSSLVSYNSSEKMVFFEHRLYLPMVGIFIFFASLRGQVPFLRQKRYLTPFFAVAVIVLFSALAFNYSNVYKDKISFWQKAVTDSPQLAEAHNGLATAYLMDGKLKEAEAEFAATLEIDPIKKRVHLLLGLYYLDQGQYDKAKEEFEKEIQIDSNQFVAYHGLGRISAQNNDLKEAETYFLKTLELNDSYVLARQDLAVLYFSQNKHPQAIAQLKELLKVQRPEAMHPQILKILEIYAKQTGIELDF